LHSRIERECSLALKARRREDRRVAAARQREEAAAAVIQALGDDAFGHDDDNADEFGEVDGLGGIPFFPNDNVGGFSNVADNGLGGEAPIPNAFS